MRYPVTYPKCAKCDIEMNPELYDDVTPGYMVGGEMLCPDCFREWLKDEADENPDVLAEALGIPVIPVGESV